MEITCLLFSLVINDRTFIALCRFRSHLYRLVCDRCITSTRPLTIQAADKLETNQISIKTRFNFSFKNLIVVEFAIKSQQRKPTCLLDDTTARNFSFVTHNEFHEISAIITYALWPIINGKRVQTIIETIH